MREDNLNIVYSKIHSCYSMNFNNVCERTCQRFGTPAQHSSTGFSTVSNLVLGASYDHTTAII